MTPASSLRRYVRNRNPEESCDLCGCDVVAGHAHLLDGKTRRIFCACDSCAVLHQSVYKRIPRRVEELVDFQMSDAQWEGLALPISLAFFVHNSQAGRVLALYPGPAGATESLLGLDTWEDIAAENPRVRELQPDVEALLVNRVGTTRDYFIAPIDECYRLAGLIRMHWRGLAGGALVWGHISQFFNDLRARSTAWPN
jgi:hypothetical protein